MNNEKIAKVIAGASKYSRREAEQLILAGRVSVNNKVNKNPADRVSSDDLISVDGEPLADKPKTRLFVFYKPKGCITSKKDPQGRKVIFDYIPTTYPKLICVGRLDYNSEGILLMTNDGALSRRLELPSSNIARTYRVRLFGQVTPSIVEELSHGVTIDEINYKPVSVTVEHDGASNSWLKVVIHEGKNREIRKIFKHFGFEVNRLIRISYGKYMLGKMHPGDIREVYDKNNFREI